MKQRDHIRRTGELPREAKSDIEAQLETAREILGDENVYGPEQIAKVWHVDLDPQDIPPIPFSPHELEKAKELGMMLILRISHDKDHNPLTGSHMRELLQPRFDTEGRGKLFYDNMGWDYQNEPFFTSEIPVRSPPSLHSRRIRRSLETKEDFASLEDDALHAEWKLLSRDILPNSTSKNYLNQTKLLRDTLSSQGWLTDEEAEEVTDEKLKALEPLVTSNVEVEWKKAAELLSNLKINQRHRRTFSQSLYDTVTVYLADLENNPATRRPLEGKYDWGVSRSSDGSLVNFGNFVSVGASVSGWDPGGGDGFLGVVFAR